MNINITNNFCNKIIKYYLLNKFTFQSIKKLLDIKKITYSFNFSLYNYDLLLSAASALKILGNQHFYFIKTKKLNKKLKLKKGSPVGCKITLRKANKFRFLDKLLNNKILKNFKKKILFNSNFNNKSYSYFVNNIFNFKEMENFYYYFSILATFKATIQIMTNSTNSKKILFFFRSLNVV